MSTHPARAEPPGYAAPGLGRFFADLNAAGCRYVALHWFAELPRTVGDLVILACDEDVQMVASRLVRRTVLDRLLRRGLPRCHFYSVSGDCGGGYKGVAFFPPLVAQRMIEGGARHVSGAMVPNPGDRFLSLAFHALYHKGFASGLAQIPHPPPSPSQPDYAATLRRLADAVGFDVPIDMDSLDAFLARQGWRPTLDHLERLVGDDAWGEAKVKSLSRNAAGEPGLALFVLRDEGPGASDRLDLTCALLAGEGFHVLAAKRLEAEERALARREIRGGNWGSSGGSGGPVAAIAFLDPAPVPPGPELRRLHRLADNARVFEVKQRIRATVGGHPGARRFNAVHSSDNCRQAAAYIALLMPELSEAIAAEAARLNGGRKLPAC